MPAININGKEYDISITSLTNKEGIAIENVTGKTFQEFGDALSKGSIEAMTALIWVMARRSDPEIRFDDVEFDLSALETLDEGLPQNTNQSAPKGPRSRSKKDA